LADSLQHNRLSVQTRSLQNQLTRHHIKHPRRFLARKEDPIILLEKGTFAVALNVRRKKGLEWRRENHLFHMI
jgi:hypothetical protein